MALKSLDPRLREDDGLGLREGGWGMRRN